MPAPDYASEISSLEGAIATGELRVEQDGEMVIYQSISAMLGALTYFRERARIATATSASLARFGFSAPGFSRE